jgi:hypothetical protein
VRGLGIDLAVQDFGSVAWASGSTDVPSVLALASARFLATG